MSNMFLEALGFKYKTHVGISISANNIVELVCIDNKTKSVVKYASGNIKYNAALKEVMDLNELSEVVESLFQEADLDPRDCVVSLNVPNIHFGISPIEGTMDAMAIEELISEDTEDLYIFKKNDSISQHMMMNHPLNKNLKNVIYSVIQAKVIAAMIDIFDTLETQLIRIETSYTALLKCLQYCEKLNEYVDKTCNSVILLVTPISCSSFYMKEGLLCDFTEEPLAVKSFSLEEVYSVVSKTVTNITDKYNPKTLLVISETEEIDAEDLAKNLNFHGEIEYLNKNTKINDDFIEIDPTQDIDVNYASYITLEAVGTAVSDYDDFELDLNFLPQERIPKFNITVAGMEGDIRKFAATCIVIGVIIAFIIYGGAFLYFKARSASYENDANEIINKNNIFKSDQSGRQDKDSSNMFPVLQKITDVNKNALNVYSALSTDIPSDVYIKEFVVSRSGGIGILGEARTTQSVNNFMKGLKEKNKNLIVSKLSLNDITHDPTALLTEGVTFEIKTSNENVSFSGDLLKHQSQKTQKQSNDNKKEE